MHPIIERNGGYEMATETIEVKIPKELLIGIEKEKFVEEIKKSYWNDSHPAGCKGQRYYKSGKACDG